MSLIKLPPTWGRFLELVREGKLPGVSLEMLNEENEEVRQSLCLEEGQSWYEPVIGQRFSDFLMAQIRRGLRRKGWHVTLHPDCLYAKKRHDEGPELQWHVDAAIEALGETT